MMAISGILVKLNPTNPEMLNTRENRLNLVMTVSGKLWFGKKMTIHQSGVNQLIGQWDYLKKAIGLLNGLDLRTRLPHLITDTLLIWIMFLNMHLST